MNSAQIRLLRLLADGRFHSGEALAATLGVSRAAVWKQLAKIRAQTGVELHAVRGRGYRLSTPLELLRPQTILDRLDPATRQLLSDLALHDRVDSTNRVLMSQIPGGLTPGSVCLAEQQSAGRGRRGRDWISPFGSNIYLSVYWRYALDLMGLSGLSLAAGIAVAECHHSLGVEGVELKWPNDVHCNGQKLAGLLLEVSGEQGGPSHVVLGLGLNTRLSEQQGREIDQPWTDLSRVPGGAAISRNQLVSALLEYLPPALRGFERDGLVPLVSRWEQFDRHLGRPVSLLIGERRVEGIHRGIDDTGALLLEQGGQVRAFHAGEVSLRRV